MHTSFYSKLGWPWLCYWIIYYSIKRMDLWIQKIYTFDFSKIQTLTLKMILYFKTIKLKHMNDNGLYRNIERISNRNKYNNIKNMNTPSKSHKLVCSRSDGSWWTHNKCWAFVVWVIVIFFALLLFLLLLLLLLFFWEGFLCVTALAFLPSLNSICRPGWLRTQRDLSACLLRAGINGVCHHSRAKSWNFRHNFCYILKNHCSFSNVVYFLQEKSGHFS